MLKKFNIVDIFFHILAEFLIKSFTVVLACSI